jgi:RimJ/RimL family protein N-acetyltransferase
VCPAGDVNLFLNDHDDHSIAEIEIMIAEPASRRKGLATEALQLFMAYGVSALGVTKFRAKIGEDNSSSLQLFEKLGYQEVSRSAVFREVTLELAVGGSVREQLRTAAAQLRLGSYDA